MSIRSILQAAAGVGGATPVQIEYVGGYAAIVTSSSSNVTVTFGGNLTGGLASSASAGDLVVVYFAVGSTADVNLVIAGYTEVADLYINDTYDANLAVGYKVMGSTPDTTVTLTGGTLGTANAGAIAIQVWRNVDPLLPLDVAAVTATSTNSAAANPPAITPVTSGAVIVAGGAAAHARGSVTFSSSDLSGFVTSGGANNTNDATVGLGYATWTSGAFDPAAFTFNSTDSGQHSWAAVTLALRPAAADALGPFLISDAQVFNSAGNLVLNKPTGVREGDLMLAFYCGQGVNSWTPPATFTEVVDQGQNPNVGISYRVATASEASSFTFGVGDVSKPSAGIIAVYRNAAWDAAGAIASGSNPLTVQAVTASANGSRILGFTARSNPNITITAPDGMTTVAREITSADVSWVLAEDASLSVAGSSGTRTFSGFGGTTQVGGILASIKPAASYTKYAHYITQTTGTTTGGTSVSVNTPTCVPGNLLVMVVSYVNGGGTTNFASAPSGWTPLSVPARSGTGVQPEMAVFYRVADGSEAASYSSSIGDTVNIVASIVVLAGVNANTLTAGTTNTGSATTSITATGVTATANGVLLYFGAQANDNQGTVTFTPPSGMTEATEVSVNGANTDITLEVAYQEALSAGSTGDKTATASSDAGTDRFRAILVTVGAL